MKTKTMSGQQFVRRAFPVGSGVFFKSGDRRLSGKVTGYYHGTSRTFLEVEVVNNASKYGKWPHLVGVQEAMGEA